jgi:hypothetical protein
MVLYEIFITLQRRWDFAIKSGWSSGTVFEQTGFLRRIML